LIIAIICSEAPASVNLKWSVRRIFGSSFRPLVFVSGLDDMVLGVPLFACRGSKPFAGICLAGICLIDQHENDPGQPSGPDRPIRLNQFIAAPMNLFAGASDYTA
jgi:hypothetical protein